MGIGKRVLRLEKKTSKIMPSDYGDRECPALPSGEFDTFCRAWIESDGPDLALPAGEMLLLRQRAEELKKQGVINDECTN